MKSLVKTLVENDQDFEWYPTTDHMIRIVQLSIPENAKSILDIGAGDGRVLHALKAKCEDAELYSIELSPILMQQQTKDIIPVGTNLFEQNLASISVDYIFCNPPYSEYEEWVCKIVTEGFAKKAILIIPQRWKESKLIQKSIKERGAITRVVNSGDFLNAERQARAKIDIVEVIYPRDKWQDKPIDPFDIWFNNNIDIFEKSEELRDSQVLSELAKKLSNSTIDEIVESYMAEYSLLEQNYQAIFKLDQTILRELGIDKETIRKGLKIKIKGLKDIYWELIFNKIDAITSRLTTRSKKSLLEKLNNNKTVAFTTSNIYAIILWAIKNANLYFEQQLIDLFKDLSTFEGVMLYKSNQKAWGKDQWRYMSRYDLKDKLDHYKLDYRIVLSEFKAIATSNYESYYYIGNLHENCHKIIADVIAVLSNLGFPTFSVRSTERNWKGGEWQNFYKANSDEILFQVKAYMNGNLHFRFNQDAIMALNIEAARLLKWVKSKEEAVTEMNYSRTDVNKYYNRNVQIGVESIPLLAVEEKEDLKTNYPKEDKNETRRTHQGQLQF